MSVCQSVVCVCVSLCQSGVCVCVSLCQSGVCVCVSLCQSGVRVCVSLCQSIVCVFVSQGYVSVSVRGKCLCQSGVSVCVSQGYVSVSVCVSQGYVSVSVCVSQGYVSVSVCLSGPGISVCPYVSEVYAFVSVREMNVSVRGMCLCQSGVFLSLAVCVSRGYFCLGSLCQSGLSDCVRQRYVSVSVGAIRVCPSELYVCVSRGSFFL